MTDCLIIHDCAPRFSSLLFKVSITSNASVPRICNVLCISFKRNEVWVYCQFEFWLTSGKPLNVHTFPVSDTIESNENNSGSYIFPSFVILCQIFSVLLTRVFSVWARYTSRLQTEKGNFLRETIIEYLYEHDFSLRFVDLTWSL